MKLLALLAPVVLFAQPYALGPDSPPKPGKPKGKVTKYSWNTSKIFPGTTRDYWVYVPAQYDGDEARLRDGLPGRRRLRERERRVARARRARQPDPAEARCR